MEADWSEVSEVSEAVECTRAQKLPWVCLPYSTRYLLRPEQFGDLVHPFPLVAQLLDAIGLLIHFLADGLELVTGLDRHTHTHIHMWDNTVVGKRKERRGEINYE